MAILTQPHPATGAARAGGTLLRDAGILRRHIARWIALQVVGLSLFCHIWLPHSAQAQPSNESILKLAFLYNFAKFVEWPAQTLPNATDNFTICVIGTDQMVQAADRMLQNKQVQGRTIVMHVPRSPDDARTCQILFVDSSTANLSEQTWSSLRNIPILTVGESEQLLAGGGIIKFFVEEGKLRFEISQQAAARAQLKISSKLLKLGRIVAAD